MVYLIPSSSETEGKLVDFSSSTPLTPEKIVVEGSEKGSERELCKIFNSSISFAKSMVLSSLLVVSFSMPAMLPAFNVNVGI